MVTSRVAGTTRTWSTCTWAAARRAERPRCRASCTPAWSGRANRRSSGCAGALEPLPEPMHDPAGGLAIAEGRHRAGHCLVVVRLVEQPGCRRQKPGRAEPDQLGDPLLDRLRALGRLPHHEDRFAERWRLLLDAPGISDDEVAVLEGRGEVGVAERLGEGDALAVKKLGEQAGPHRRAHVQRQEDLYVTPPAELGDRRGDGGHRRTLRLPPV